MLATTIEDGLDEEGPTGDQTPLLRNKQQTKIHWAWRIPLEFIATLYGNITGLLIWRAIIFLAPIPDRTASNMFLMFLSSLLSSSGIILLCRHHIYETARRIQQSDKSLARTLWQEFCGDADTETSARVMIAALKLIGGVAEGAITYNTMESILENSNEDLRLALSSILAGTAFLGFILVEGSKIKEVMEQQTVCVYQNKRIVARTKIPLLLRPTFPDNAILEYVRNQTDYMPIASPAKIIFANIKGIFGVLGIVALAYLDSLELSQQFLGQNISFGIAAFIASLYYIADSALHSLSFKLSFYGINEHKTGKLIKHNFTAFLFTLLQAALIGLVPFAAMIGLFWHFKSDSPTQMQIYQQKDWTYWLYFAFSGLFALARLPLSFCGEGLAMLSTLHEGEHYNLFNQFMNMLLFCATAGAVAWQMSPQRYDWLSIIITYAIAGGANTLVSALRHALVTVIDQEHLRAWKYKFASLAKMSLDFLLPALTGGLAEALFIYLVFDKPGEPTQQESNIASICGGIAAGGTSVLLRFASNKYHWFYEKGPRLERLCTGLDDCCQKVSKTVGAFFSSHCYDEADLQSVRNSQAQFDASML